jgi:phosphoribosylaminoimidazole carboxylase PurE protein
MAKPIVGIVMGSDSDLPIMEAAEKILSDFKIPYETTVASAHRTPSKTAAYASTAVKRGLKVIIAGAGAAAHLAGFMAAETTLPIIGVPIESSPLKGMDALLATVQMPGGVPVASMAIGKAGAKNAALFAIQILATSNPKLRTKLKSYKKQMAKEVEKKDKRVKNR